MVLSRVTKFLKSVEERKFKDADRVNHKVTFDWWDVSLVIENPKSFKQPGSQMFNVARMNL